MKMWKKAASIALVSALTVSMAACGNGGGSDKGSADADTFKIGGIGPTTGDATAVQNGIQLAIDEINEAGGINGYQIEFKFEDDQSDSEKSVNAYNTLKDWGMQMLVGTTTSTPCTAVVEETHADNMFQLTPSATAVESIQYDNAFRMCFSDPDQGKASADYISENNLAKKIAVIYNSCDTYSSGVYQKFAEQAKTLGLDIVAAEAFTADSKTDFSVQLQKAKDAGAELVFLPIYYQEASLILAQANKAGFTPKWFGCDAALAENLMFLTPFTADAEDEATQKFVSDFEAAFKGTPNQFAADAYDCVYVIKEAAEKAELTPDMSVSDMSDALKKAMTEIKVDRMTGKSITWSEDGEPTKDPTVVIVQGGVYKILHAE